MFSKKCTFFSSSKDCLRDNLPKTLCRGSFLVGGSIGCAASGGGLTYLILNTLQSNLAITLSAAGVTGAASGLLSFFLILLLLGAEAGVTCREERDSTQQNSV